MLNLLRLRMLRDLHRLGTLARVAESLSYTPSAVSQQLAQLEKEAGTALLEHVGRGVRLTPAAVALVGHTEAVLARLEEAEAELAGSRTRLSGVLRIASFQSAVLTAAPTALDLLGQRHPELEAEITQREVGPAYEGLLAHDFDVIIGEEYPDLPEPVREGVDRIDLLRDPLRLLLPTVGPWSRRPERLADLTEAPWALDPADSPTGMWARGMCRSAGFEPRMRIDTLDPLLQIHLVRTGHAVAFVPALIGQEHLAGTRAAGLPGDPHRVLYTSARAGGAGHPAITAFRRAFAEAVGRESAPDPAWTLG